MTSFTYKQLLWLTFWLWLGFVVGMSVLVPHKMAAHPAAQGFANFMAQFIPMLNNIRKIPGATEWVRFYYAVFWAVSPVFAYIGWCLRRQQCIEGVYLRPMSDVRVFFSLVVWLGFCAVCLVWPVADGKSWRDQGVVSNLVGIAHFTMGCVTFVFGLGASIRVVYARLHFGTTFENALKPEKN